MTDVIDEMLARYEAGQISRRTMVATLAGLVLAPGAAQAQTKPAAPLVPVRSLNHVSISVADVDRSVAFYQSVFGMRVISREGLPGNPVAGGAGVVVNLAPGPGPEFLGIYKADPPGHIGHFCLGVPGFDADKSLKALQDGKVNARMRQRGESKEIFLTDPDNVQVQLTDATYCGGSGRLGNVCKP